MDRMQLRKEAELQAREEELRLEHGREVIALKQENYILQSKVNFPEFTSLKRDSSWRRENSREIHFNHSNHSKSSAGNLD